MIGCIVLGVYSRGLEKLQEFRGSFKQSKFLGNDIYNVWY